MYNWFQNLKEDGQHLIHFRGSFGSAWDREWIEYEFCTGWAFRFMLRPKFDSTKFTFGAFFFSVYLTIWGFRIPLLKKEREYGFYTHDWRIWIFFGSRPWESSSKDPWYYRIVIDPIKLIFGKQLHFSDKLLVAHSPRYFLFRGKEYCMDEIKIVRGNWFRSRVPFSLYRKQRISMEVEIKNPPKHAGKGENSWDCGDDGTYGMSRPYSGPDIKSIWLNQESVFEYCCLKYCEHVVRDIQKYGRASDDQLLPKDLILFSYIGRKPKADSGEASEVSLSPNYLKGN